MDSSNQDIKNHKELENNILELRYKMQRNKNLENVLRLYSVLGILISILAAFYFILITLKISLNFEQQISLIAIGTGITLSVLSRFLLTMRNEKNREIFLLNKEINDNSKFILLWTKFENTAKEKLLAHKDNFNIRSIRDIITLLVSNKMITKEDEFFLESAIKLRNTLLHTEQSIPSETILEYSKKIEDLLLKIKE